MKVGEVVMFSVTFDSAGDKIKGKIVFFRVLASAII
jgi:hypothetical protein